MYYSRKTWKSFWCCLSDDAIRRNGVNVPAVCLWFWI